MRSAPYVVPIPHIYPSVGYCVVYFCLGPSTTFNKIGEIGSTLEPNDILYFLIIKQQTFFFL